MVDGDTSQPLPPAPEPATPQGTASEPAQPVSEQAAPETPTAQIPVSEPITSVQTSASIQSPATPMNSARDLLVKARATIQDRKARKLEKILEALNAKGNITNDEVEKLLHISDATATRYLSALEKQGKITQVGKTGHAVTYTKS